MLLNVLHLCQSSRFPVFIHLENHCSVGYQKQMASLFIQVLKSNLHVPAQDEDAKFFASQYSPEQLKKKFILMVINNLNTFV